MKLSAYLAEPRPAWDWQHLDCCRWVDGWCLANGWGSPIGAIGIRYDSERSALLTIRRGGGLVALWTKGMAAVGIGPVDEWNTLAAGDIGVIRRPTACGADEAVGIWTGERWVTLGLRGLDFGPAEALAVWRG